MTTDAAVEGLAHRAIQEYLIYEALDRGPVLVFVADETMQYLAVNQTACDVLGYTRAELLSLRVTDVAVAPEAAELYQGMVYQRGQSGRTAIRTKAGDLLLLDYRARPVEIGGLTYYVSIGTVATDA